MNVIRSMRGGKDYDSQWGRRMRGSGPYAWQIARRFELAAKRLGLNERRTRLDTGLFTAPVAEGSQLALL
jgi:DNA repair photolyase